MPRANFTQKLRLIAVILIGIATILAIVGQFFIFRLNPWIVVLMAVAFFFGVSAMRKLAQGITDGDHKNSH